MEKIIKEFYVYDFDELSDEVKQEVIKKHREYERENYCECMLEEDMNYKAKELIKEYFNVDNINVSPLYDLSYSQGSGAMIIFSINIKDLNNKYKVFSDEEIRFFDEKSVVDNIRVKHNDSHYYHEYTFDIDSDYYNYWNYDEIKDDYNISEEEFNTIDDRFYKLIDYSIRNCRDNKFAWDIVNMNSELGKYGYECIEYYWNCTDDEIIENIKANEYKFLESGEIY